MTATTTPETVLTHRLGDRSRSDIGIRLGQTNCPKPYKDKAIGAIYDAIYPRTGSDFTPLQLVNLFATAIWRIEPEALAESALSKAELYGLIPEWIFQLTDGHGYRDEFVKEARKHLSDNPEWIQLRQERAFTISTPMKAARGQEERDDAPMDRAYEELNLHLVGATLTGGGIAFACAFVLQKLLAEHVLNNEGYNRLSIVLDMCLHVVVTDRIVADVAVEKLDKLLGSLRR